MLRRESHINFCKHFVIMTQRAERNTTQNYSGGAQHLIIHQQLQLMLVIFWNESGFCIILIARIHSWKSNNSANTHTAQKMKFSLKNFFSKCDQNLTEKCHTFFSMWSFFACFNMQILNLCYRWNRHIHNPLEYLKWSVLTKWLTTKSL